MDPTINNTYQPAPEDQKLQREAALQVWKERAYRFFYNIWPSVNRVLTFFFYHTMRILKGSVKIAMEQFKQG